MKKLIFLGIGIISCCLVYLAVVGISLRIERLIKPSSFKDLSGIAQSTVVRLYPSFDQYKKWIVFLPSGSTSDELLKEFILVYGKNFSAEPRLVHSQDEWDQCTSECWWLVRSAVESVTATGENLEKDNGTTDKLMEVSKAQPIGFLKIEFLSLVSVNLEKPCLNQRRLQAHCLRELSIHQAAKKMKQNENTFFLNRYLDRNFFLFIHNKEVSH